MESVSEKIGQIADLLKLLGLSSYESQGFAALVYHGVANADTIADSAKIPRTSAYKVMESLVEKGFARFSEGRPRMFKPEELSTIRARYEEKLDQLFMELRRLEEMLPSRGEPQLVYTITQKEKVLEKIEELINLSERELYISTPQVREIRLELKKAIENAVKRGVNVVFVVPYTKKVPPNVMVYRKDGLIATDAVSDRCRAILASPDLEACGYTDNPSLALHVYQFISMLIETSSGGGNEVR